MSRDLAAPLVTEVTAALLRPVFLAEFLFDSGAVRFWNGLGEVVAMGNTYIGAGNLLSLSEYKETQKLEALGLTFTLTGISPSILSVAQAESYQGRTVNLYLSAINSSGALVTPYQVFGGQMDVMSINLGAEFSTIAVSAESKLIMTTRTKERRYTAEDQKNQYPGDKGFDFVTVLQDKEIYWGRKQ
jgi:hypothetical protein